MKLQLSGGHYDNGRFWQFIDEVREDGVYGTRHKMDNTSSSNVVAAHTRALLLEMEQTSVAHVAQRFPKHIVNWYDGR